MRFDQVVLVVFGIVTAGGLTSCIGKVRPLELELGRMSAVDAVEFGTVQVGDPREILLEINNPGPGSVHFLSADLSLPSRAPYRFEVEAAEGWLHPGDVHSILIRFVALGESREVAEATLNLLSDTDDPDRPGNKQSLQVALTARAVQFGLVVAPNPVELGLVESGTQRLAEVRLTNRLDSPLQVYTPDALDGRAALFHTLGAGVFSVDAYVGPDGAMPRGRAVLAGGESLTVPVAFLAPSVSLGGDSEATWRVAGCEAAECVQSVNITASSENDALVCVPEAVDFGQVFPGLQRQQPVRCTNRSQVRLRVVSVSMRAGSDPELDADAPTQTEIDPGGSFEFSAWFRPTEVTYERGGEAVATAMVSVVDDSSGLEGSTSVSLLGQVGGAHLEIRPNPLDFGEVAINTERRDVLFIENVGFETARIQSIEPDISGTGLFRAPTAPFEIPAGATVELEVFFSPRAAGTFTSAMRLTTNDAVTPSHVVGLTGVGLDLNPCLYGLDPAEVQFGAVYLGQEALRTVTVRNVGPGDCLVRDFRVEQPAGQSAGVFALADGPSPPMRLAPGQTFTVRVRFAPADAGDQRASLTFYVSDPAASNPQIPLIAAGRPLVEVECAGAILTAAGQPVVLTAQATALGTIISYDWAIVSAPVGGIGTPDQWQPAPPNAVTETFLPFIVGVYEIQVTVLDDRGNSGGCTTEVTAEGRGLRVTLTWDGPGDVDLHVRRGLSGPWYSDNDCYYANRTPIWDVSAPVSQGQNPELDFDNTSARGPENTRINAVQVGETYTIGAHNFSNARGRSATMQIFCGGGTVPDAVFTSRPLAGVETSNCSGNDFWKVASVVFNSSVSCQVTALDTYVSSRTVCQGF